MHILATHKQQTLLAVSTCVRTSTNDSTKTTTPPLPLMPHLSDPVYVSSNTFTTTSTSTSGSTNNSASGDISSSISGGTHDLPQSNRKHSISSKLITYDADTTKKSVVKQCIDLVSDSDGSRDSSASQPVVRSQRPLRIRGGARAAKRGVKRAYYSSSDSTGSSSTSSNDEDSSATDEDSNEDDWLSTDDEHDGVFSSWCVYV